MLGVMISGFITDAIGTHSVFGAFVFGLVIPNGPIGVTLIEKLEDFVSGLLLPLFFAISGLKTEIGAIEGVGTWGILVLVIVLAYAGKIAGSLVVALYYQMPFYEGVTLGLLMNTKGLVEMVLLNVGKDQKVYRTIFNLHNTLTPTSHLVRIKYSILVEYYVAVFQAQ